MPDSLAASVIVIGDEILSGHVIDANSGWLAQRLQAHGVPLERVVTIPDQIPAIVEALRAELARSRPRLVLTSGGVGSTPDDLTYEAVAKALDLELVMHPVLAARVYGILERALAAGVDVPDEQRPYLEKMARVPRTSELLGGEGLTPGVVVAVDGGLDAAGATVVMLPGIPGELQRITRQAIEPTLLAGRGDPQHIVELFHPYPESLLNPVLHQLVDEFPAVHVGSYPGRDCLVRLKGPKETVEAAALLVEAAIVAAGQMPGAQQLASSWQAHWDDAGQ